MGLNFSILITIILVYFRNKILDRIGFNNKYGNIVYIFIIITFATILNMYKISFSTSSMNDEIASQLIQGFRLEKSPIKKEEISNIIYGKSSKNSKNVYSIKAEISKNGYKYYIYMKSHCSFLEGCSVSRNELTMVDKNYVDKYIDLDYSIISSNINEEQVLLLKETELFDNKSCANFISIMNLKYDFIKENSMLDIQTIKFLNTKISNNISLEKTPGNGYRYTKGCKTTMNVKFKIKEEFKEKSEKIKNIFSNIKENNGIYEGNISAIYDIYVNYNKKTAHEHKFLN